MTNAAPPKPRYPRPAGDDMEVISRAEAKRQRKAAKRLNEVKK